MEDKNTVSDYRPIELERQNSVSATILYTLNDNKKINIIDTPGFDDFCGEVISALRVVDTAVMLVNGQNGVEVGTEITWRYASRSDTPVIFIVNHLDQENANFDETLRQLKQQFGATVVEIGFAPDDLRRAEPLLEPAAVPRGLVLVPELPLLAPGKPDRERIQVLAALAASSHPEES